MTFFAQSLTLGRGQVRRDVRDHHVEAGQHGVTRFNAMNDAIADIGDLCTVIYAADMDASRIEAQADRLIGAVERAIVERRRHDVAHRVARRCARNEGAHQKAGDRGVAVGEMIDVGLLPRGIAGVGKPQPGEARIAEIARLGGRHRVAAEPEEAERAALETVRRFLAAAAVFHQIVAIAGALRECRSFPHGFARKRIAPAGIKRNDLCLARLRDRKAGHEFAKRFALGRLVSSSSRTAGIACDQHVAAERLAVEEHATREPQRRIEAALEGRLEPRDVDPKIAQQALGHRAVQRLWRLQRLAAAVADDTAAIEREFVALGVAAEIVVIVEDQDSGGRHGAPVEPCCRKPADAAANHDEIIAFLDRQAVDRKLAAFAGERMRDLERALVLSAHPRRRRRVASRLRRELRRRRQPGSNRQSRAVEKITPGDG